MASTWWPIWLNNLVAVCFVVIAGVHLVHAASAASWPRLWHGAHGLMAVGMVAMTWPEGLLSMASTTWTLVFGVAAVALAAIGARPAVRGHGGPWTWLSATLGLAAMAYMFAMGTVGHAGATLTLSAYFLVESAAWASGQLAAPAHGRTWVMRVSLSAMGLGMAYMLVAMQFGTTGGEPPDGHGHHHQHLGILYGP